jgi:predicted NBD/HSP70 family sugar kinase
MIGRVLHRAALAAGPASRSEISKGSMLESPRVLASGAVGKAADVLIQHGFLREEGLRKGQPGPPSMPLRLGSSRWVIVGIHIDQQHEGPDTLTGVACGLDLQPLSAPVTLQVPKEDGNHDLRGLAQGVRHLTETLLAQRAEQAGDDIPAPGLLAVGVELGGHVHRGTVIDSTHAGWSGVVPLSHGLTQELGGRVPVIVENDVNALAIHGYFSRRFQGSSIALAVVFRLGVGGGLLLNGRIYRGIHSLAPEPGHLTVEYPDDTRTERLPSQRTAKGLTFSDECLCSRRDRKAFGHVDTLATPARIEGQLAAIKPHEKDISLERAAAVPRVLPRGDQFVFTEEAIVLRRAGRALGRGLAHIINIVNPGQLVLLLPRSLATPAPRAAVPNT